MAEAILDDGEHCDGKEGGEEKEEQQQQLRTEAQVEELGDTEPDFRRELLRMSFVTTRRAISSGG
jgi:hypothetical protein